MDQKSSTQTWLLWQKSYLGLFLELNIVSLINSVHFEQCTVKNRDAQSPGTHPHMQKNTFLHPNCFHRVTHGLPWDKTGPLEDCKVHRSHCFECEWTVTGVPSYSVRRGFWQGTHLSFTFRLLRKMQVQGVRSVLDTSRNTQKWCLCCLQPKIASLGAPMPQALPSCPESDEMPGVLLDSLLKDPGRTNPEGYLLVGLETWETDF